MQRLTALPAIVLAMALLAPLSQAQVRGTPAPDSHKGAGRAMIVAPPPRAHAGVMPTPMGVSPVPAPVFPRPTPIGVPPTLPAPGTSNGRPGNGFHHHHRHRDNFFGGAYPVYVPVPVAVDPYSMYQPAVDQTDQESDDQDVAPGPTVFERRTPAEMVNTPEDFAPAEVAAEPAPAAEAAAPAANDSAESSQPAQPQDPSVLIFRDGHRLEIENYAIVGKTLYDFTPGHMRRVPLSQLDLSATVKANEDRGVDFTLPASSASE